MLAAVLQNHYVFAVLMAILTSVLAYALSRMTDTEPGRPYRTFFKTLVCALAAGALLAYMASRKTAEPMATEPFDMPAPVPMLTV